MSFISAPFKEDKGKKILSPHSSYVSWDYLKDTRPEADKKVFPIGQSDGRSTKFKLGFYRRPAASIAYADERIAFEESKQNTSAAAAAVRSAQLREVNERNGNIIQPREGTEQIFQAKRRFPSRVVEVAAQNHARQKVGASRFHIELTDKEQEYRNRQIGHRLESQKQTSSVIGYGRSDLSTYGVVDNFCAPSQNVYSGSDLISRPKLRPPPSDSVAARRNQGQICMQDGSGGGPLGGGTSGMIGNRRSGAGLSSSASQSRLQTGTASSPLQPIAGRRGNRGNASSSQLLDAFNYQNVVNVWKNGSAINTSTASWGASSSTAPSTAPAAVASLVSSTPASSAPSTSLH